MTVQNFVRIVWTVFAKIEKVQEWSFFGHFRANFGTKCFSIAQTLMPDFDAITHIGLYLVWNDCRKQKTSFESYGEILRKSEKKSRNVCFLTMG